ncbi:glycine cleavage system protein R [Catenovulum adriaticum]|uniref:Glycine cleavage system transcriptional repressor n=1 Tax=Catenovulum adriaticum TaxID=2984846 RepID=A0ABY7AJD5_9ALTE|nr:ACT domain-containing protein [Catenovulum sp. TS8]WAJ69216.1 glycine cleavage system protein R [Catenovulum sp. TS8]
MHTNYVISIITRDKPGVIEKVSKIIDEHKGNWLASNFCRLSGQFAGIVEFSCPTEESNNTLNALESLSGTDFQLNIAKGDNQQTQQHNVAQLTIMGNDKTGIIKEISHTLASHHVNLLKLTSTCESAPNWGSLLFKAQADIEIPSDVDLDDLTQALEEIANDLIVDVEVTSL